MKFHISTVLCLVCSYPILVSALSFANYKEAKTGFEAAGKIQRFEHEQAKKWFRDVGYGKDFETYAETKDFLTKKGYLSREADELVFVREGESVDTDAYHDVMTCLFLSNFVYSIASLRKATKKLSFTTEELKDEVTLGNSFQSERDTHAMSQVLTGNLKVSKDPAKASHYVNMKHFEDVLDYEGYGDANSNMASELTVSAMKSFQKKFLQIYKFDAKYNDKNLVYSIAGRETKNGETDLYLSFRGSSTLQDWKANIVAPQTEIHLRYDEKTGKAYMIEQVTFQKIEIEKDLYDEFKKIEAETGAPIKVHLGFLKYLFADRGMDGKVDDDKIDDSMYTNIRLNVWRLMNQEGMVNKKLYVTGHSLGGALATLASFFLASEKKMNNKSEDWRGITCVSYASPIVGNVSFRRAFEVLQARQQYQSQTAKPTKVGRLFSNIRITNSRDPVPWLVFFSSFRHVAGYHVKLNRPSLVSFFRPRKPSLELERSERKIRKRDVFKNLHKPWLIFPPMSMARGLLSNSRHLFGLLFTVVPSVLIPLLALLRNSLPTPESFTAVFTKLAKSSIFLNVVDRLPLGLTTAIAAFSQTLWFKIGLWGIPIAFYISLLKKENTGTVERAGLSLGLLIPLTHYFKRYEQQAIIGLLVAQVLAFAFRAPSEMLSFETHSLGQYYKHLRPHHQMLSSSEAVYKQVENTE